MEDKKEIQQSVQEKGYSRFKAYPAYHKAVKEVEEEQIRKEQSTRKPRIMDR